MALSEQMLAHIRGICDERDLLRAENATLRQQLADVNESMGRVEERCAKLRELCAIVIDDWMSKVCPTFPFCECGGEYESCTDESCGNQCYRQMLRELGVEVDG